MSFKQRLINGTALRYGIIGAFGVGIPILSYQWINNIRFQENMDNNNDGNNDLSEYDPESLSQRASFKAVYGF